MGNFSSYLLLVGKYFYINYNNQLDLDQRSWKDLTTAPSIIITDSHFVFQVVLMPTLLLILSLSLLLLLLLSISRHLFQSQRLLQILGIDDRINSFFSTASCAAYISIPTAAGSTATTGCHTNTASTASDDYAHAGSASAPTRPTADVHGAAATTTNYFTDTINATTSNAAASKHDPTFTDATATR